MKKKNKHYEPLPVPETGPSPEEKSFQVFKDATRLIQEESNRLITWCLTILGATILFVSSASDYFHPDGFFKYTYTLYFPGWAFLLLSIYYGEELSRRFIAAMWQGADHVSVVDQIKQKINHDFKLQLNFFRYAVLVFAIWIFIFLFWFIIFKK